MEGLAEIPNGTFSVPLQEDIVLGGKVSVSVSPDAGSAKLRRAARVRLPTGPLGAVDVGETLLETDSSVDMASALLA